MPRPALVLAATSLAAFTATLDNTVVAVALRDLQRSLGSGVTGLQGVVTAYLVALAALLLAGGALVDRWGAHRVLQLGLAVFAGASVGCATAGSVETLIWWRAVQGTGAALMLPGGLAVLADSRPDPADRRRAIGLWAAAAASALVAGPVVGGALVAAHGWPAVFWINLPLCGLVALAIVRRTGARPARQHAFDGPGTVLTCLVLGLATYAVVLLGRGGQSGRALSCLVLSGLATAALAMVERRRNDPLLPADLLATRGFRGAVLGTAVASLALFVLLVFVSLFLELVQDLDAGQTGLLLLPLPLALVVAAALSGRWHAVVGPLVVGLLVSAAGLLVLGLRLRTGTSHTELRLVLAVIGAGVGLTTAPLVSVALAVAQEARAGLAAAAVSVARELGGVLAIAGLGSLAVARLSARLTTTLADGGVSPANRPELVNALLGARASEVRRLLLQDLTLPQALALGGRIADSATESFVASTRLVLLGAGATSLFAAVACGWLLTNAGSDQRGESSAGS